MAGPLSLSKLIAGVGDEHVKIQNLLDSADTVDKTKHGTKISFFTDAIAAEELFGGGEPKMVGLVIWLPRDRVDAVRNGGAS